MKTLKIYYEGEVDNNMDEAVEAVLKTFEYKFVGSGHNMVRGIRDLEFEKEPK